LRGGARYALAAMSVAKDRGKKNNPYFKCCHFTGSRWGRSSQRGASRGRRRCGRMSRRGWILY